MQPELIIDLKLYPTSEGGRLTPIMGKWFGCPCKFRKEDFEARDCRVLLGGKSIAPGESARLGVIFLSPDSASLFQAAGKFFLWEGKIIGEATVVAAVGHNRARKTVWKKAVEVVAVSACPICGDSGFDPEPGQVMDDNPKALVRCGKCGHTGAVETFMRSLPGSPLLK